MAGIGIAKKGLGLLGKNIKKSKGSVEGWRKSLKQRSKVLKEGQERLKKHLNKKKGKDLDWDDVKASGRIFTKK